jgi:DNA-binding response OmpR family regulator
MRILIVEDDLKLARFLVKILTEEGYAADVCRNGAEAVPLVASGGHDLVLLDLMLPGLDGLSVCRQLREAGMAVPILMLTARGELEERVLGLESGADDYVVKPFEVEELLARVKAVSRRSAAAAPMQLGPLAIDRLGRRVLAGARELDLTARELDLLVHLAFRREQVVSRADLLTHVWGMSHDPGTNVVDVHVSRLRDKLEEHAWMIETVRGSGYRFRASRPP